MTTKCQGCGENFEAIGRHWSQSSNCDYKKLTQEQREITTGLLMGDGNIDIQEGQNPRLRSEMITKEYLKYIDGEFGILGTGVSLIMTAKENAEKTRSGGFRPNAQAENYSDLYRWRSRRHPGFEEFTQWYSTGKKVWPENIKLTPTVLKHWYCGDGSWDNGGSHNRITIAMANEVENTEKVSKLFENVGLPSPSNYVVYERKDGYLNCQAQFTVEQSKELWQYMGEPLPDFEYKWPKEYRD